MFRIISRLTISYVSSTSTLLSSSSSDSSALLATPSTYFSTHLGFKGLIIFYWVQLQFHFSWYYYNILLQGWSCINSRLSSFFECLFPVRTFTTILLRGWSVCRSNNFCPYYNILLQGWSCINSRLSSFFECLFPVRTFTTILLRGWSVW